MIIAERKHKIFQLENESLELKRKLSTASATPDQTSITATRGAIPSNGNATASRKQASRKPTSATPDRVSTNITRHPTPTSSSHGKLQESQTRQLQIKQAPPPPPVASPQPAAAMAMLQESKPQESQTRQPQIEPTPTLPLPVALPQPAATMTMLQESQTWQPQIKPSPPPVAPFQPPSINSSTAISNNTGSSSPVLGTTILLPPVSRVSSVLSTVFSVTTNVLRTIIIQPCQIYSAAQLQLEHTIYSAFTQYQESANNDGNANKKRKRSPRTCKGCGQSKCPGSQKQQNCRNQNKQTQRL
jgi:hypothetical protein